MSKLMASNANTLQGVLPPSEKAAIQYRIDNIVAAIQYHEMGDETDPACCTATAPCQIRISLLMQQRDLAKGVLSANDLHRSEETEYAKQATKGEGPYRNLISDPATPAQLGRIRRVIEWCDTSKLGTFPARTLAQILEGREAEVSKTRASSLITALGNLETVEPPPTQPQLDRIRIMCAEQGREIPADLNKRTASDLISKLIKSAGSVRDLRVTKDGMYRTSDGTVYKIQIAKQGSGNLYAKRLVERDGEWSFEYDRGAINRLKASDRMTLEQAQEFGRLYGVCCKCGADLTDEESIAFGIGPVCRGKI